MEPYGTFPFLCHLPNFFPFLLPQDQMNVIQLRFHSWYVSLQTCLMQLFSIRRSSIMETLKISTLLLCFLLFQQSLQIVNVPGKQRNPELNRKPWFGKITTAAPSTSAPRFTLVVSTASCDYKCSSDKVCYSKYTKYSGPGIKLGACLLSQWQMCEYPCRVPGL